jgi:hypothetical protein
VHLTGIDLLFWAASFLGHIILLSVLLIRRRAKEFPVFTTLITANIARTIVLFLIQEYGTKANYFYTYWSLAVVDVMLQFGVVYEMTSRIFRPLGAWATDIKRGLVVWIAGSIALAAGLTWLASPPTRLWIQTAMIRGNFFSAALLSELFVGMIVLSVTAGLPWKTHVARIAQGLGIYSVFTVLIEAGRTYFGLKRGTHTYDELSRTRIAVYLVCVVYWIIMLWREAPQPREMTEQMRRQLLELQRSVRHQLQSLRSRRE